MKTTISIIIIGIIQMLVGAYYGLLAPIRVQENISFYTSSARGKGEEKLRKEHSELLLESNMDTMLVYEMREIDGLSRLAKEGWNSLSTASFVLAIGGFVTFISGIKKLNQNQ